MRNIVIPFCGGYASTLYNGSYWSMGTGLMFAFQMNLIVNLAIVNVSQNFGLRIKVDALQSEFTKSKTEEMQRRRLLEEILPPSMSKTLIDTDRTTNPPPEEHPDCTIFFSDIVGFTSMASRTSPRNVFALLHELYTSMDRTCQEFGLFKVETIGDSYMVVGGLYNRPKYHAIASLEFALSVVKDASKVKSPVDNSPLKLRIGLHSGGVIAGIAGQLVPRYCLFGDTVNVASRMESLGDASYVHCSDDFLSKLKIESDEIGVDLSKEYRIVSRGLIEVKGKERNMKTYFISKA